MLLYSAERTINIKVSKSFQLFHFTKYKYNLILSDTLTMNLF
jgi:hypothetical protein